MVNLYNNPSLDPADNNSLAGSIRFAFSKLIQNVQGMLPAQVIAYDRTTNRVQVQLLISQVTTDGSALPRPQIASIPVLLLGGGGMFLSFPITTGDLGWVIANDRDISNFLQTYSTSIPNTNRISQFSDGLFIPDVMRGYTISGDNASSVVLQNLDGSVFISINNSDITITAADTITINAPTVEINATTVTGTAGSVSLNSTGDIDITSSGNAIYTLNSGSGVLAVVGDITATGTINDFTPPP
jgi:hypothetical protein